MLFLCEMGHHFLESVLNLIFIFLPQAVLEEFEDKLTSAHNKGLDQEATEGRAEGKAVKSVCVRGPGRGKTPRKTPGLLLRLRLSIQFIKQTPS